MMRRVGGAIDAWWREPAPAERLAAVRVLVGFFAFAYLAVRVPHFSSYARFDPDEFRPVGVVALALNRPLLPVVVQLITMATLVAAGAFVVGWRHRFTGPAFAALLLWTLTYRNSWGMVFHTENLLALHVMVLGLTRCADTHSMDARRGSTTVTLDGRYGWPLRLMCVIVVIVYVLAGVAKLRNGGVDWLWGDELRNHVAVDNVRKLLMGDVYSPLAGPVLHWGVVFKLLALMTVVVELGAPLALLGRRAATVWVAFALGFHFGVLGLMFIVFPYQLIGVAYVCFFRAERVFEWIARVRDRHARARSTD